MHNVHNLIGCWYTGTMALGRQREQPSPRRRSRAAWPWLEAAQGCSEERPTNTVEVQQEKLYRCIQRRGVMKQQGPTAGGGVKHVQQAILLNTW